MKIGRIWYHIRVSGFSLHELVDGFFLGVLQPAFLPYFSRQRSGRKHHSFAFGEWLLLTQSGRWRPVIRRPIGRLLFGRNRVVRAAPTLQ